MKEMRLWTPESPVLYDVRVELKASDGTILDTVKSYVGMRSIAVGKDDQACPGHCSMANPIMLPGALDQGTGLRYLHGRRLTKR